MRRRLFILRFHIGGHDPFAASSTSYRFWSPWSSAVLSDSGLDCGSGCSSSGSTSEGMIRLRRHRLAVKSFHRKSGLDQNSQSVSMISEVWCFSLLCIWSGYGCVFLQSRVWGVRFSLLDPFCLVGRVSASFSGRYGSDRMSFVTRFGRDRPE